MMGERVAVLRRSKVGEDAMGDAVYGWSAEYADGCLVRPLQGSDAGDPKRPDGVRAEYDVAFRKSYTAAAGPLRGCRVALVERGMDAGDAESAYRVVGSPDVTDPCPTAWNLVARIGRSYG